MTLNAEHTAVFEDIRALVDEYAPSLNTRYRKALEAERGWEVRSVLTTLISTHGVPFRDIKDAWGLSYLELTNKPHRGCNYSQTCYH